MLSRYELDYSARWSFWRVSGVALNRMWFEANAGARTVSAWHGARVACSRATVAMCQRSSNNVCSCLQLCESYSIGTQRSLPCLQSIHMLRPTASYGTWLPPQVTFKLREPGFLRTYQGTWRITPQTTTTTTTVTLPTPGSSSGSSATSISSSSSSQLHAPGRSSRGATIQVEELLMSPKVTPPPPLNRLLKGLAERQVGAMLQGLVTAATQLHSGQVTPQLETTLPPTAKRLVVCGNGRTDMMPADGLFPALAGGCVGSPIQGLVTIRSHEIRPVLLLDGQTSLDTSLSVTSNSSTSSYCTCAEESDV